MLRTFSLLLLIATVGYSQWRDSSRVLVPAPSGKAVKTTQFAIGDTNTWKVSGAIAYMGGNFYIANGTYYVLMAGSGSSSADTATFVTKGTTQVITSPKYYTARQNFGGVGVDTIYSGIHDNNVVINDTATINGILDISGLIKIHTYDSTNIFIGNSSGNYDDISSLNNVYIGLGANSVGTSSANVVIGANAGVNNYGGSSVIIGNSANANGSTGGASIYIGDLSGQYNSGSHGVMIGYDAGRYDSSGSNNTYIGNQSGLNSKASNVIAVGNQSAYYDNTISNSLFINSLDRSNTQGDTTNSIIFGVQASSSSQQRLKLNAETYIKHGLTVGENAVVSAGYVDSDSSRDDGTTWRTSVAYHSGLGGSTFGNLSTGTITSNGNSITGGAGSFTTGTFSGTITQNGNATGNMVINNSTGTPLALNVYSNTATTSPLVQFNRARGTSNASYSGISSGDVIFGLFGSGAYSAAAFSGNTGGIRLVAAENYSATNQATYIDMATTAIGATSRTVDFVLRKTNALPELTLGTTAGTGTGNLYIDSLYFGTTLAIDANRKHTNVGGIATTGAHGVAPIVDTVTYAGVASSISAKSLTATAGMYRITYNLFTTTAGTGGTVTLTLTYNNGAAQTITSAAVSLTSTSAGSGGVASDAIIYTVASGTPQVSTTVSGATGSPVYRLDAIVERLK